MLRGPRPTDERRSVTDRQTQRKIDRQRQNESRWLQKVLFDLGKAREAREKLSEVTGDDLNPLIVLEDGTRIPLDTLEEIIRSRIDTLMEHLGQGPHRIPRR
jgi:hypothetical protein